MKLEDYKMLKKVVLRKDIEAFNFMLKYVHPSVKMCTDLLAVCRCKEMREKLLEIKRLNIERNIK